ncbi:hypothetical protein ACFLQI_01455 [Candidatus Undinarchaeota archaeon]
MRAQAALEAMMVLAVFAGIIGMFGGMYIKFSEQEMQFGSTAKMGLELARIANAVDEVYFLGRGNSVYLDLEVTNFTLSSAGRNITMERNNVSVSKKAFGEVETDAGYFSERIRIRNDGNKVNISSE